MLDLFGGKGQKQDKARAEAREGEASEAEALSTEQAGNEAETKPEVDKTGQSDATGLMAEVKASEKPIAKELKFKTKSGHQVEVKYLNDGTSVEDVLKAICEVIDTGEIEITKE